MEPGREQLVFSAIRRQVRRALGRRVHDEPLDAAERALLIPALRRQRERYTVDRHADAQSLFDDDRAVAAYLAYYGARSAALAAAMARAYALDGTDVLELGSGPGSAGLAVLARVAGARWRVVEPSTCAVRAATALAADLELAAPERLAVDAGALLARPGGARTVLAFLTVNEWPLDIERRAAVLQTVLGAMPADGRLVVVEPALREVARDLSALRDALVLRGAAVLGPCTHQRPCPVLARRRDYCHGRVRLALPDDLIALGHEAGHLDLADADLASLVLAPAGTSLHGGHRVIGDVRREKGRDRLFVCGDGQLRELSVLTGRGHRDATWLRALGRGDVIALDPAPQGPVHRLSSPAALQRRGWLP